MATPNAFSNLLGKENKDKEKLISRGACISWGPKNLGSWLIMSSVRWMAENTDFRTSQLTLTQRLRSWGQSTKPVTLLTLGRQYVDPDHPEKGWFSGREFRKI